MKKNSILVSLLVLALLIPAAAALADHTGALRVIGVEWEPQANAQGVCPLGGTLLPRSDVAVVCSLNHDERAPLAASIETGSLDVQAWLLRATGRYVLVALSNTSNAPVALRDARITLGRMAPATPARWPDAAPTNELCMQRTIAARGDTAFCALWKTAETETPAAGTAGAE